MTTPPTEALPHKDKPTPKKGTWLGLYGPATEKRPLKLPMPA